MIRVTTLADGQATEFRYDGRNRRAVMVEAGTETRYRWCGTQLCLAMNAAGAALVRYYPEGEFNGGYALVYATDHLGSVRHAIDVSLGKLMSVEYDTYGRRSSFACQAAEGAILTQRWS